MRTHCFGLITALLLFFSISSAQAAKYQCHVLLTEHGSPASVGLSVGDQVTLTASDGSEMHGTFLGNALPDTLAGGGHTDPYYWFEVNPQTYLALTENEVLGFYSKVESRHLSRNEIQIVRMVDQQRPRTCLPRTTMNCLLNLNALGALPPNISVLLEHPESLQTLIHTFDYQMALGAVGRDEQVYKGDRLLRKFGLRFQEIHSFEGMIQTLRNRRPVILGTMDIELFGAESQIIIPSLGTDVTLRAGNQKNNGEIGHAALALALLKNDRILVIDPATGLYQVIDKTRLRNGVDTHDLSAHTIEILQPTNARTSNWKRRVLNFFHR